jgi:peptide/nickel transport system substrate-binding protein
MEMFTIVSHRSRSLRVVLKVAALAVLLAWLGAASASAADPKTITAVMHADVKIFDPIVNTADITSYFALMVFDTLFSLDQNLTPQPQMVGSYKISADGLTYTFVLRDGLKFHDGAPVTAEDVVASLKRWWVKDGGGQIIQKFSKELTAVDNKTFRLVLNQPYGLVLDTLAKPDANVPVIMPKRLASTDANQAVAEVVGSGPFKFVKDEWVPGSKLVFAKNTDYVPRSEPANGFSGGKVVKVDRVEWVVLPDSQSAIQALNRGQIDFIEQPQVDLLPLLKANKDVRVEFMSSLGTQGILRLNHLQPPFTDVRARRAMQWLVNQRDFMTAAIGDPSLWKVCGSFLICDQPMAFNEGAEMLNQDIPNEQRAAKAKELLQQAGYKGELVVLLDPVNNPRFHAANLVFSEALKKAGVNVQLDAMDWGTLVTRRTKKDPVAQGGWSIFFTSNGGLEGSNPAFNISTSAGCDKAWWGWPCDPKLEELRSQWALATTLEARKKVAQEIQVRATEDVIYIPWGVWRSPSAMRSSLKNMLKVPDSIIFWNVEKN